MLVYLVEDMPEAWARPLSIIPFSFRLGHTYTNFAKRCRRAENRFPAVCNDTIYSKLGELVSFAASKNEFYTDLYPDTISRMCEKLDYRTWQELPIITKKDFKAVSIEKRVSANLKGILVNTGGTSGQPLDFYLDDKAFAREWAHMHHIWKARGYRP